MYKNTKNETLLAVLAIRFALGWSQLGVVVLVGLMLLTCLFPKTMNEGELLFEFQHEPEEPAIAYNVIKEKSFLIALTVFIVAASGE